MRKLTRGTAPTCLSNYQQSTQWSDLSKEHYPEIWTALTAMQSKYCVYCEGRIEKSENRHIEHFRRRQFFQNLCFSWENLFGSCSNPEHCGHFKDSSKNDNYQPEDLVKPDEEDPRDYLLFLEDGSVQPQPDLSPTDNYRAVKTIQILGLNHPTLKSRRSITMKAVLPELNELVELSASWPNDEIKGEKDRFLYHLEDYECAAAVREQICALIPGDGT